MEVSEVGVYDPSHTVILSIIRDIKPAFAIPMAIRLSILSIIIQREQIRDRLPIGRYIDLSVFG